MHTKAHEKLFKSCLLLLILACVAESYDVVGPPYTFLEQKKFTDLYLLYGKRYKEVGLDVLDLQIIQLQSQVKI